MMMSFLELVGNFLLFALVFGMSATVDIECMAKQVRNKNAILLGTFCQFILLPFLGFAVVNLLQLEAPLGITLLVVTSSPGGSYSNWWCSMFNADLALSVTMTAISTVLSIIALPANLLLYANISYAADVTSDLDWRSVFIALAIVISAIALGLYSSYRCHSYRFNIFCNKLGNVAGFLLILFSATVTNTGDSDTKIWSREGAFYIACIAPCVLGLVMASVLASLLSLQKPERMTVAIECCYQNVGIATSLALTMFRGNDLNHAMGVPFFYGFVEAVFVGLYCVGAWKAGWSKAPANVPFWKILFTTYEVLEAEKQSFITNAIEISLSDSQKNQEISDGDVFTTYFSLEDTRNIGPKEPSGYIQRTHEDPESSLAEF